MAALNGHTDYWNTPTTEVLLTIVNNTRRFSRHHSIMGISDTVLFITIVLGNSFVVLAVWKDPLKILRSSPSNYIIVSLALADLVSGVNQIVGAVIWFLQDADNRESSATLLMLHIPLAIVLLAVSVGHLMLLTVDRFYAIVTPLHYRHKITKTRVTVAKCFIWSVGVLSAILFYIFQQQFLIIWFVNVWVVWLASKAMSTLYTIILYYLHKHSKASALNANVQRNLSLAYQREKKVSKLMLLVAFVFHICFLPWWILHGLMYFCQTCQQNSEELLTVMFSLSTLLPSLNSALNPLLYAWRFAKFRATFKYFLRTRFSRWRNQKVSAITEPHV